MMKKDFSEKTNLPRFGYKGEFTDILDLDLMIVKAVERHTKSWSLDSQINVDHDLAHIIFGLALWKSGDVVCWSMPYQNSNFSEVATNTIQDIFWNLEIGEIAAYKKRFIHEALQWKKYYLGDSDIDEKDKDRLQLIDEKFAAHIFELIEPIIPFFRQILELEIQHPLQKFAENTSFRELYEVMFRHPYKTSEATVEQEQLSPAA